MKKRSIMITILLLLLAALSIDAAAQEDSDVRRWFPESGHWVEGAFLSFYESYPSSENVFGYPITEKHLDPLTGVEVQYFQNSRFEQQPLNTDPNKVSLSNLGTLLYTPDETHEIDFTPSACTTFNNSNQKYLVCYTFLTFYEDNQGTGLFGQPISNLELEGERIVQYFEKARLEWHPEFPSGQRVLISDLGRQYLEERGEMELLAESDSPVQSVLSLQMSAFAAQPVVRAGEDQTIHVIVRNQNEKAVSGVQVEILIDYPDGTTASGILQPTDIFGVSSFEFSVPAGSQGLSIIHVEAASGTHTAATRTSFRIWY